MIRIMRGLIIMLMVAFSCTDGNQVFREVHAESPLKDRFQDTTVYELQSTFHEIYELYKESVVFISTEKTVQAQHPLMQDPFFRQFFGGQQPQERRQTGLGTGFFISSDGYIATNHHVVAGMDSVKVILDDQEFEAEIIGSDETTDVALLKINASREFQTVHFGDSDRTRVGDWAIAIGNPFGLDRTFTVGVISAIARRDVDQLGNSHIQTDASINPGNSGGPLINLDGEVIGMNRMIYSRSGGHMGIGFAIPINTVELILEQLQDSGSVKRGYLGVQIAPMNERIAEQLALPNTDGALVASIMSGSPAQRGGIQQRDVIIELENQTITDYRDLVRAVHRLEIGQTVDVVVWRSGERKTLSVTIQERPTE